jgi:hypothetical protein
MSAILVAMEIDFNAEFLSEQILPSGNYALSDIFVNGTSEATAAGAAAFTISITSGSQTFYFTRGAFTATEAEQTTTFLFPNRIFPDYLILPSNNPVTVSVGVSNVTLLNVDISLSGLSI